MTAYLWVMLGIHIVSICRFMVNIKPYTSESDKFTTILALILSVGILVWNCVLLFG